MGKTPHHSNLNRDTRQLPDGYCMYWRQRPLIPVREHTVYTLRYGAQELRDAAEEGRRPRPTKSRHAAQWWTYTDAYTPSSARSFWANKHERANRRYVKRQLNVARHLKGDRQQQLFERATKKPRRMVHDIW